MKKSLFKAFSITTILALMLMALPMQSAQAAGSVSLTTLDSAYTQDFNTLAITGTTNTTLPTGWDLIETGGGTRDNEQYAADNGGSTTGDTYSYGATANTERAYGGLRSGTLIPVIGASFTNNTGATITTLDVAYMGEQWRAGVTNRGAADRIDFQLSTNATSLTTGTWIDSDNLDFNSPNIAATAGALDGNAPGNRTSLSSSITGLSVANGSSFWIRWNDFDISSSDDGLSIDDFSLIPHSVIQPNLTINDVTLNEGNSGTTSFVFSVSLSAPAGPGGVTFDIATADGTAQDDNPGTEDNDYVAQSLTGQSIPAGSSGPYNFTVTVNGDTTDEPNETFLVNVINVTGAAPTDGQGQGTIQNDDAPTQPPAGSVVISEVYGGGGNAGATYTNDFIELYNRTASSISLAGWSVQYTSAAGTTWQVTPLTGSIGAGKYYLVQEGAGAGGTTPLPSPDATGGILMSATAGKVALVQNSTALTISCPTGLPISDFVGYGTTANCFEGSGPTPAPSNTTSVIRLGNGATDTDNNAADFVAGAPDPDNSADTAPSVSSTTPADGAANVLVSSNIDVTFSEPVNATSSSFTISCGTSGPHTAAVTGGPTTYTLNPDTDFVITESCTVTVVAAQVTDQDTDDPPDNMTADFGFSFATEGPVCSQTFTPIYSIEGSGATAAITGNVTTQGVVVGDFEGTASASGFYIQDATGDGNPATSDGIFVFTGAANTVSVGDLVRVTGFARERFNQTTLNGSNSDSSAVPAGNIVNCGTGTAPVTNVSLPFCRCDLPRTL
jgi:Predicted extracellular nuclease